jgi:hypothetical protein
MRRSKVSVKRNKGRPERLSTNGSEGDTLSGSAPSVSAMNRRQACEMRCHGEQARQRVVTQKRSSILRYSRIIKLLPHAVG